MSCVRRNYTLIEMIVVCVLVMLTVALVTPRIGGSSKRMSAEQALSAFREAFGETAMRSRATGKSLALLLVPEAKEFRVSELTEKLDKDWHPPILSPATGKDGHGAILPGVTSYPVPDGVEWTDLPDLDEEQGGVLFTFHPDGEASGPELAWDMHGRSYRLIIDSVLGKATILEEEK